MGSGIEPTTIRKGVEVPTDRAERENHIADLERQMMRAREVANGAEAAYEAACRDAARRRDPFAFGDV
jgi:hypothetical protein